MNNNSLEITIAHFTAQDIQVIMANIAELSKSERIGNANSLAQRFDAAIKRAETQTTIPK